jgi:hypothetical protein
MGAIPSYGYRARPGCRALLCRKDHGRHPTPALAEPQGRRDRMRVYLPHMAEGGVSAGGVVKYGTEVVTDPGVQLLISRVVGAPIDEASGWLADEIRYHRFKRQLKVLEKAAERVRKAGLEPAMGDRINLGVIVPLLEAASLTGDPVTGGASHGDPDDAMAERWAALLARAVTDPDGVPPSYPDILRQLTPREAALLDGIYKAGVDEGAPLDTQDHLSVGTTWLNAYEPYVIAADLGWPEAAHWVERGGPNEVDAARLQLTVENLLRLRLIKEDYGLGNVAIRPRQKVGFTPLGYDFVKACRGL